jgi:protein O-GlcNAc transferase
VNAEHWVEQGRKHHTAGRWRDAEICYRQALALDPRHVEALHLLGLLAHQAGHSEDAIQLIRQALDIQPHYAIAWNNLATIYHDRQQLRFAHECLERALQLQPDYATAHNNLGEIYKALGHVHKALDCYRRALACDPNFLAARSNYLMTLLYDPDQELSSFLEEVQRWGNYPVPRHLASQKRWSLNTNPHRRLRIGYVSPDFRKHAVMRFFLPILEAHDPDRVEVYLYAQIPAADAVSERLRMLASGWRVISLLSAAEVARLIQQDHIDILVDLAGHFRHNRLDVFALQPAPIQCIYLGYSRTNRTSHYPFPFRRRLSFS